MCMTLYSNYICNSLKLKAIQMAINMWKKYICSITIYIHTVEWKWTNTNIHNCIDKYQKHYVVSNKPDNKEYTLSASVSVKF